MSSPELRHLAAPSCISQTTPPGSSLPPRNGLRPERAGGFQLVEVFHDEVGDVEFKAGAFEPQPFHADLLFAQTDDQADDFAIKAGRDLGHVDDFHGPVDQHGDDGVFHASSEKHKIPIDSQDKSAILSTLSRTESPNSWPPVLNAGWRKNAGSSLPD
jgi:hypothetical protein